MARPSEPTGGRLRTRPHRLRAGVGRHRHHLLVGLALVALTTATTVSVMLGARALGPLLAIAVVALFTAERIEAA